MKKLFKKTNKQAGAITFEASIALTSFLFFFMMIYSVLSVCRAQATIQVAINSAAKEISQYSYLYYRSGMQDSLGQVQNAAQGTKDTVNSMTGNVVQVFSGIESLGRDGEQILKDADVTRINESWETLKGDAAVVGNNVEGFKESAADLLSDPKAAMFGAAKLFASEGLEVAKSALSEVMARALIQKNLKMSEGGSVEAFCHGVGIVPGTYMGTQSRFNGIDFSHSSLFPYGSQEITIVANYKVKLLQLLPIDTEIHITQSAVTRGWNGGDGSATGNSAAALKDTVYTKDGNSLWNTASPRERTDLIRHMGIDELKDNGYYGVSGQTHIHAYNPETKTFAMIRSYNPMGNAKDITEVDKAKVKEYLKRLESEMLATTDNIHEIKIKKKDSNNNLVPEAVECSENDSKKIVLVIPEDPELKALMEEAIKDMGSSVEFELNPSYGNALKAEGEKTEGS